MAWKLTLDDINKYKNAFSLIDKDKTGKIPTESLGMLMRSLGKIFSNKDLEKIIEDIDKKGNGFVELHEFINLMADVEDNRRKDEDPNKLIKAFKYFDRNNVGSIDYKEIHHALTTMSEKFNEEEANMFETISNPKDGKLDYKELLWTIYKKK